MHARIHWRRRRKLRTMNRAALSAIVLAVMLERPFAQPSSLFLRGGKMWHPIETAPSRKKVLLWLPNKGTLDHIIIGHRFLDGWITDDLNWMNDRDDQSDFDLKPSHWMPLPDPPSP